MGGDGDEMQEGRHGKQMHASQACQCGQLTAVAARRGYGVWEQVQKLEARVLGQEAVLDAGSREPRPSDTVLLQPETATARIPKF